MYEGELFTALSSSTALIALLSTYKPAAATSTPSIFDGEAPENTPFPYLVYRIESYPVDGAVTRFNVVIDYFGHRSVATRTKARQAIDAIVNLLKYKDIDTVRFGKVTHFEPDIIPVPEPDSRAIHYNIRCEARGIEKQWLENL